MRLAVLCHPSAGGSGVVATELALALAGLGHHVHVVATQVPFRLTNARLPRSTPDPTGFERGGGVYFHAIAGSSYPLFDNPLTSLAASNTLASVVAEHGVELVHAHYAIPHATSALLARDMLRLEDKNLRVVTTLHGTDVTLVGLEPGFWRSTRYAIEESNVVTAVSQNLAAHTSAEFALTREIDVVHNWVDADRFRPIVNSMERARYAEPNEAIVMHTSNFRAVKRPEDVIRTFYGINAARPARLLLVGDGPERPRCAALARELGVADRVHFLGTLPGLEAVLGVADVFLLPSSQESFGLAALEAMACGVPVVASRIGGLPEVVSEGVSGFLHDVGDVPAMVEAALMALESRSALGRSARDWALTHFRPGVILPRYVRAYQRALDLPER